MTYIPSPSEETHVLAVIELTGKTLYFADSHLSMSDGNFYEGRLEISGSLQRGFSSWTEPRQRQSTLAIMLKDRDRTIRGLLESYTWGLRRVKVYVGQGRALGNYVLDFEGIIKFPNGISYNDSRVRIQLRDARDRDKVTLPAGSFSKDVYPRLEDGAKGKPIPVVYGDWSDRAVPAFCTDTATNEFIIAGHPIKSIVQVYQNGLPVSHTDEDLAAATFRIASYAPRDDVVTVALQGKMDAAGVMISHPVDILYDLQTDLLAISAGDIEADSYAECKNELLGFLGRRWIGARQNSDTLTEEIAIECGFDPMIQDGKYVVRHRTPSQVYETLFDASNVKKDSLSVEYDPEQLYCNRAAARYEYDPVNDTYLSGYQADNADEQAALGQVVTRTIEFKWLYKSYDVEIVIARTLLLYSTVVRVVSFTGLGEALLTQLADRVGLSIANFTRRPLLVRGTVKGYKNRSCEIVGYDVLSYAKPGYFTDDAAPDYASATDEERVKQGFWTDDDGCAIPGDTSSKTSHWF